MTSRRALSHRHGEVLDLLGLPRENSTRSFIRFLRPSNVGIALLAAVEAGARILAPRELILELAATFVRDPLPVNGAWNANELALILNTLQRDTHLDFARTALNVERTITKPRTTYVVSLFGTNAAEFLPPKIVSALVDWIGFDDITIIANIVRNYLNLAANRAFPILELRKIGQMQVDAVIEGIHRFVQQSTPQEDRLFHWELVFTLLESVPSIPQPAMELLIRDAEQTYPAAVQILTRLFHIPMLEEPQSSQSTSEEEDDETMSEEGRKMEEGPEPSMTSEDLRALEQETEALQEEHAAERRSLLERYDVLPNLRKGKTMLERVVASPEAHRTREEFARRLPPYVVTELSTEAGTLWDYVFGQTSDVQFFAALREWAPPLLRQINSAILLEEYRRTLKEIQDFRSTLVPNWSELSVVFFQSGVIRDLNQMESKIGNISVENIIHQLFEHQDMSELQEYAPALEHIVERRIDELEETFPEIDLSRLVQISACFLWSLSQEGNVSVWTLRFHVLLFRKMSATTLAIP